MQKNTLTRRSVTTGIAWSVPAVAAASAAPAFAASPVCVEATSGQVIKYPGNSSGHDLRQAYGFDVVLKNTTKNTVRIAPGTAVVDFEKKDATGDVLLFDVDPCTGGVQLAPNSPLLELAPGESAKVFLVVNNTGNSANEAGCVLATLRVLLVGNETPIGDLCETVDVSKACFSETPPTATC